MKTKLIFLLSLLCWTYTWSQTTLFSENIGTPSGTTTIAANTFQNNGLLTYSSGAQTTSADVRSTSASSSYSGASGGGNIYFTATSGAYGFSIEGINASNYNTLSLQFGYKKESASAHAAFSVDYWNGASWVTLANSSSTLFNEAATLPAVWYLSKTLSLPTDAQIGGLKIRFVKTGTVAIRIDDVKLTGIETTPSITNTAVVGITSNSATFAGNVTATGGSAITATGTVYAPTLTNANPVLGGSGVSNISTPSPNSGTGSFSNSSGAVLSPNIQYSYNAFATKSTGLSGYGSVATFYALAVTPSAPVLSSLTGNTINVAIGTDANSSMTAYAIFETTLGKYVQANGTLGVGAVYQTAAIWGNKTVTGLSPLTSYTFNVIAMNGDGITTSAGASANGSTTVLAVINTSGSLASLSTVYGTVSSATIFSFSGSNLTDNVIISAPTGFEISKTAGGTTGYATTLSVTPSSGTITSTTIYVRLAATSAFGSYSGNINIASIIDGVSVNVPTVSSSVSKLGISISGINIANKAYDSNIHATITGTAVLNGILSIDTGNVTIVNGSGSANFADATIGNNKTVIITGYAITGSASNNYEVTQPTGFTANITANMNSDIVINSSSPTNSNTNIDYSLYQGTTLTNTGTGANGSVGVLGFYLRDGGAGLNDADDLPTELTDLTIHLINPANIRSVRLFVGSSPRGVTVAVNGASVIYLTGLTNVIAQDNTQLALNVRITYNSTVTDNQTSGVMINGVTAKSDGSLFSSYNGGGVNSVTTGDINRLEVTATHLEFLQQPPSSIYAQVSMTPSPSIMGKDYIGNIDLDYLSNLSITSSGTLNVSPISPSSFINGIYEFDAISHTAGGTGLILTANAPGLTSASSNSFNVIPLVTPQFTAVSPICVNGNLIPLPTISNNGIVGTWSPEINNTATTTYTFNPTAGQNAASITMTIVVNDLITPEFTPVAPIYVGGALSPLPTTSNNGIVGTWAPALNNATTTTYTFTPNAEQCATTATLTITVEPNTPITPTFNVVGPICSGRFLSLPTTSTNGIVGSWSPAVDNTATTTYTFTPNLGQGTTTTATIVVTVNPTITPTFDTVSSINSGQSLAALPTTSNNGYTGSWMPSIDNTTTTTYLFTPNAGGCVTTTTLTIVVTEPTAGAITGVGGSTGSSSPTAQKYHDTQGKLEISNSGSAAYNLPIAMPPSIQNVGPTINLIYNSGQMNGIAGQGWSINSISAISRIATRLNIDGFIDGVDFDDNDKLALDGQRLLTTGAYFGDGTIYQTETQSNTRIEQFGTGTNIYFVVTAPDGSRSWYGNYGGENAVDNTAFYVTRFEDTNGNYIKYHYYKPYNKSLCIQNVQFSANTISGIQPQNSILFNYKMIERTENAFIKGIKQEKEELLDNIEVYAGSSLFRKYKITHVEDTQLGYQRVSKIQEFNGSNEPANPVEFEYYETTSSSGPETEQVKTYNNNFDFQDIDLAGDFDGDGRLDFAIDNQVFAKLFEGNSGNDPVTIPFYVSPPSNDPGTPPSSTNASSGKAFVATTLTNNKLNQFNSIINVVETSTSSDLQAYNKNPNEDTLANGMSLNYTKSFAFDPPYFDASANSTSHVYDIRYPGQNIPCPATSVLPTNNINRYLEGDFNGDGISEVLISRFYKYGQATTNYHRPNGSVAFYICHNGYSYSYYKLYYANLDPNASTSIGSSGFVELSFNIADFDGHQKVSDFNGDGKSDILVIKSDKSYKLFSFKQLTTAPWVELEVIGEGTIDKYAVGKQILYGDYNGDGKTDIMVPDTTGGEGDTLWNIYYSNPNPAGGTLFVKNSYNIVEYRPNTGGDYDTQVHFSNYYALDVNKDGKTDMVRVWRKYYKPSWTINDHDTQWKVTSFINNIGNGTQGFIPDYVSPCASFSGNDPHTGEPILFQICNHNSDSPDLPIPLASEFRYNGKNNELIMYRNHTNQLTYINFTKDVQSDVLLKKITSSGGNLVDEINYKTLEPSSGNNGLGLLSDFYSSSDAVTYPNVELRKIPSTKLVSKLTNTVMGVVKYQDFRYHGFVMNLHGTGIVGFRKTARSAWYLNPTDKRIWTVSENNPSLRGAMERSYTQLFDNGSLFSFTNSGTPPGIINSLTNTFISNTTNGLFTIYLNTHTNEDFLTNVKNEKTYTYLTPYILEGTVVSKNYLSGVLQGTTTDVKEYDNSPAGSGSSYYIGRPTHTSTTIDAYTDSFFKEELFTYTGSRLTKTEKKANNTDGVYLTEEFEYFPNGNLKKKTLSAPGATPAVSPRVTELTYDSSERFIQTSKDIEGLVTTNNSFHPLYGIPLSISNPFGLTTTSEYDNWGKQIKATDYLGKNTYFTYSKSNGFYTSQQLVDNGTIVKSVSDALGRVVRSGNRNINGVMTYINTEYDFMNRKKRVSEPYLATEFANYWTDYTYDENNRLKTTTYPSTLTSTITYSGLTVSVTDGTKTGFSTKNANGDIVSTGDNGGIITNTYFANGNLKTSTYGAATLVMGYDGWGRQTSMDDPSAGLYHYDYNAYGETIKETTPKGEITYDLLPSGKVNFKTITSMSSDPNPTNTKTTYTYDGTTKLLSSIRFDDYIGGFYTNYSYGYDQYNRLNFKDESGFQAYFQQATQYDAFGRPEKELYSATNTSDGKQSIKWIKHTYKNGYNWQIVDDATSQVLWQTNTVNARGQLESASLGNNINISNTYNQYGFLTETKHDRTGSSAGNVMTLNTNFNYLRGNLISRYNNLFNTSENFLYDNFDRLTDYPDASGQTIHQAYELDGRIKTNNLGTYNYDPSATYRNNSIESNPSAIAYYQNRSGIFNDNMESKTGWLIYDTSVVTFDNTESKSGTTSIKIHNTASTEKIVQSALWIEIDNAAPTEYTYSGWVKSTGPDAEMFLYMKTATETGAYTQADQIITTSGSNWVYFEKTVLVPANIKKLNLRLDNNGTGDVWFDDVKIRKTNLTDNSVRELNITYNAVKSPIQIEETNVDKISFDYNYSENRSTMYYGGLENDKMQRQYRKHYSEDGTMEIKQNMFTGDVEFVTYIGGDGYTAPVVLKSDGNVAEFIYLHRDYQGSIVAITDHVGNTIEKRLYDAWGQAIKIEDGQGNSLAGFVVLDRGYTGHEHLQSVGLIHMNARLYDPKLHRFLQPDNFIQDPSNTQNFNRYGYVLNNPLKYTDPSGEVIPLVAIGIGAFIAALTYTVTALVADVPFTVGGLAGSAFNGAVSSGITFGIGEGVATIKNFYAMATVQALAHGTYQGVASYTQGGSFWSAFAAGSLSSIASSAWSGGRSPSETYSFAGFSTTVDHIHEGIGEALGMNNSWGMIIFGTVSGGAGASLSGGNFWQGAVTGLVVSGLNHAMHEINYIDGEGEGGGGGGPNCPDCPKNMNAGSSHNSSDGNTYSYGIDGAWHLVGPTLIGLGTPFFLKDGKVVRSIFGRGFQAEGAVARTSLASPILRKVLPVNTGVKILGTRTLGGILGRFTPYVGWGLTIYDLMTMPPVEPGSVYYNISQGLKSGNLCFIKGTLVLMENKLQPIESIKIGDKVYSFDLDKNEIELSKVLNVLKRETDELYEVQVSNEKIYVTSEHPFYVVKKGWVKVKDLNIKDILKTLSGELEIISIKKIKENAMVYNIEVDDNSNYFVTESKILVHNKKIINSTISNDKNN
jgi:RHS repeat-associated protein